jgi:hypothetical protein
MSFFIVAAVKTSNFTGRFLLLISDKGCVNPSIEHYICLRVTRFMVLLLGLIFNLMIEAT